MNAINFPAYFAEAMEKRDAEPVRKANEAEAARDAEQARSRAAFVASRLTPCNQPHSLRSLRHACGILARHDGELWPFNIQMADLLDACEARGLRVSRAECGQEAVWARLPADLTCRVVAIYAFKWRKGWASTAGDCKTFIRRFFSSLGWSSNIRVAEIKKLLAVPKRQSVYGEWASDPIEEQISTLLASLSGAVS
ncbi:hypothetical protein K6W36_01670 [Acetobacter senegalensis]|uniref:hypothetical protein n=1 Tax=Acetobacter senegalensis TaxID=446692 RepID=UPI001EDBB5E7|nr:hypothetical protein [Acetobacter senegalensis]MCG4259298.1 hypothetical protein [Acetobacter senegalensis]